MADTPADLLSHINASLLDLPNRLANILDRQISRYAHVTQPGTRTDGRDAQGRFQPGEGGGQATRRHSLGQAYGIVERGAGILPNLPPLQATVHKVGQAVRLIDDIQGLFGRLGKEKRRGGGGSQRRRPPRRYAPSFRHPRLPRSLRRIRVKPSFSPQAPGQRIPRLQSGTPSASAPPIISQQQFQQLQKAVQATKISPAPKTTPTLAVPTTGQPSSSFLKRLEEKFELDVKEIARRKLPEFMQEEDLSRTPDQAARLAKDRAIAARKQSHEVEAIGRSAFEFAHENTTNRGAIHQRELLRAKERGLSDEEAMRHARDVAEGNATSKFNAPKLRVPPSETLAVGKGAPAGPGHGSIESREAIERLADGMAKLDSSINSLKNVMEDQASEGEGTGTANPVKAIGKAMGAAHSRPGEGIAKIGQQFTVEEGVKTVIREGAAAVV